MSLKGLFALRWARYLQEEKMIDFVRYTYTQGSKGSTDYPDTLVSITEYENAHLDPPT